MGIALEIDRVHWEHNDLMGMLSMRCELPGAKTVWGNTLRVAAFNISGPRGRLDQAKFLADRTSAPEYDWVGLMEEFCQRILADQCEGPKAERLARSVLIATTPATMPTMTKAQLDPSGG